ncbi:uncharacterized protein LOC127265626 isoform X2 [Andrographis paniculata]|uniref:uncharacterized protein LOC127265626 isoform X2 n=1 Tax=Andrographis paniculata TaxID=175694 RepID=UPI0021E909EA|nr:uncharacterized protein LOC127265626 isoform X2 [Andrographis paniculata]
MLGDDNKPSVTLMEEIQLYTNWDDFTCPICLDFPHNAVLLQCSSFEKGCRSFVCDTGHLHSNCLDRFKQANGMSFGTKLSTSVENAESLVSESDRKPQCPLCRGEVTGWLVVDKVRMHLNQKKRCCEEEKCPFTGTYLELKAHARVEHPHACPSKVDPARQLDWEDFQQSSEIIDVLSTIHSEVRNGVVLGDYVIEYADDNSGDEFHDFPGNGRNWWTSCILYQIFKKIRMSRNRRRLRGSTSGRGNGRLSFDTSNSSEGSLSSVEYADYRVDEADDDFVNAMRASRGRASQYSTPRRRSGTR